MNGVAVFEHPEILAKAKALLQRGGGIKVAIQGDLDAPDGVLSKHPLVAMRDELARAGQLKGHLTICPAKKEGIKFLQENDFLHHWQVMDKQAYRLETDDNEDINSLLKKAENRAF